ncbi:MAG: hypothetical protein OD817_02565 [Gammaproteobacteria bacterium]
MLKIDSNAFQEDLRRLGLIMPAAGLIGHFIEQIGPDSLIAAVIGAGAWLIGAMRRAS